MKLLTVIFTKLCRHIRSWEWPKQQTFSLKYQTSIWAFRTYLDQDLDVIRCFKSGMKMPCKTEAWRHIGMSSASYTRTVGSRVQILARYDLFWIKRNNVKFWINYICCTPPCDKGKISQLELILCIIITRLYDM